jgi:hypothetical protein
MSIKVNNINKQKEILKHYIRDYIGFLDSDNDFYLIDGETYEIVHLHGSGVNVHCTKDYDTIEDFLAVEFGYDCELQKVFTNSTDYEIIVNC